MTPDDIRRDYARLDDRYGAHHDDCPVCRNNVRRLPENRRPCPAGDRLRAAAEAVREEWRLAIAAARR